MAGGADTAGSVQPFCDITLHGVILDVAVTMDRHVTQVIRCYYYTCALRHIHPVLTLDATKTIAHGTIAATLD